MLPEEILKDDVEVLREEQDALFEKYQSDFAAILTEINIRIEAGKADGFNAETW